MKETIYKREIARFLGQTKYFYTFTIICRYSGVYTFIDEGDNNIGEMARFLGKTSIFLHFDCYLPVFGNIYTSDEVYNI